MNKLLWILSLVFLNLHSFSQDTISTNIYQNDSNLGIGTNSPEHALTIEGTETSWPQRIFLSVNNKSLGSNSLAYIRAKAGPSDNHTIIGHISETYTANDSPQDLQDYGVVASNGNGLIINASRNNSKPGIIKFLSGQSSGTTFDERMRIDSTGNIGIGTTNPTAQLDINGDVKLSGENSGLILKSPDGTEWKITVDNSGELTTSLATPPTSLKKYASPELQVNLHPNPSNNIINCEIINANNPSTDTEIYNLSGKMVYMKTHHSSNFSINVSDLENGYYVIKLKDPHGSTIKTEKIIKQ